MRVKRIEEYPIVSFEGVIETSEKSNPLPSKNVINDLITGPDMFVRQVRVLMLDFVTSTRI